ncbi:MAG: hypothetical protein AAB922_01125 [Patescibacteria group bacterium]
MTDDMEPMIIRASRDETNLIIVEAVGGSWEGLMSHGDTIEEAFRNFGEAAMLYAEARDHIIEGR